MDSQRSETTRIEQFPAVLFADVSGWVSLVSRLGDLAALARREALFGPLRTIVTSCRGRIVKSLGDALMCVFETADDAAQAACLMQSHNRIANRTTAEKLLLQMGFHAGPVISRHDGDIEGDTVNMAARVIGESKPERILLTAATADLLSAAFSNHLLPWQTVAIKGKEELVALKMLEWRDLSDGTEPNDPLVQKGSTYRRLTLRCQGRSCILERGGKPLTFGRGEHNILIIDDPEKRVSSSHGKIEVTGVGMVLTDTSTHGIYIEMADEPIQKVGRTVLLHAAGRMALGQPPHAQNAILIDFTLE